MTRPEPVPSLLDLPTDLRSVERGEIEASLHWLRRVPLTATPGFLEEVGQLLAESSDVRFEVLGRQMRDQAAQRRVVPSEAATGA